MVFTDEQKLKVAELYDNGMKIEDIRRYFHCNRLFLVDVFQDPTFRKHSKRIQEQEKFDREFPDKVKELWSQGLTQTQIARQLKVGIHKVRRVLLGEELIHPDNGKGYAVDMEKMAQSASVADIDRCREVLKDTADVLVEIPAAKTNGDFNQYRKARVKVEKVYGFMVKTDHGFFTLNEVVNSLKKEGKL